MRMQSNNDVILMAGGPETLGLGCPQGVLCYYETLRNGLTTYEDDALCYFGLFNMLMSNEFKICYSKRC